MLQLARIPFFVILMGVGSIAMLVPAIYASVLDLNRVAQPFFYGAVLFGMFSVLVALATMNLPERNDARNQLVTLFAAFSILPIMLAIPMREAMPNMRFFAVYFEMVSSITTTGASVLDNPANVPPPIHLWRALVAWLGGFLMLLSAIAILAPLNLGGFEVLRPNDLSTEVETTYERKPSFDRLARFAGVIFPSYLIATGALWLALSISGVPPFVGLCLALSTLSTSGIVPVTQTLYIGVLAEVIVVCFLLLAVSRSTFISEVTRKSGAELLQDREVRSSVIVVTALTLALFVGHWFGPTEVSQTGIVAGLSAIWGAFFTFVSFLTTTGFLSGDWASARDWTGISSPELVLAGLCILGGGVATTAGGVKLLRVYALYRHGVREMARLVHPSSIGRAGRLGRVVRRQGAFIAWIFFMLFGLTTAAVTIGLSFSGLHFDEAFIFAISALSTTGPLPHVVLAEARNYGDFDNLTKSILMLAMVLGRLETLAIIALFNPDFWRR